MDRRAVPLELRAAVGKREIKRSLGTKDSKEAKRKNQEVGAEVDRDFQAALETLDGVPTLDDTQVEAMAARWLHMALEDDVDDRIIGGGGGSLDADGLDDFLGDVREALAVPVDLKFARPHACRWHNRHRQRSKIAG